MLRSIIIAFVFLGTALGLRAQDIHFSQFYASPVTLNPAMTGLMEGCYRAALNFRNQYPELYAYSTFSAAGDAAFLKQSSMPGFVGAGLWFYNDRQGDGKLNHISVNASGAYHLDVTGNNKFLISLGGMVGFSHKNVDITKLTFETQQNGQVLDNTLSNGESLYNNQFNNLDLAAGVVFSGSIMKDLGMNAGFAVYNITEPEESFLNDESNVLGRRYVGHLSARYQIDEVTLTPSFLFQTQSAAREIIPGLTAGYIFNEGRRSYEKRSAVYLGVYWRVQDAITLLGGVEFGDVRLGISYDINYSSLNIASNTIGGIELSLAYERKCYGSDARGVPPINCPRF